MKSGRRVTLDVAYNNKKITNDIAPFITDVSFTDNLSGAADDISISLGDRDKKWIGSWMPREGASLDVTLIYSGWDTSKYIKKKLGYFEIDEIEASGPPTSISIKAVSIPESSSLRGQKKSRSWEKVNLKKVAQDIAATSKISLIFLVNENPEYDRLDQEHEQDLIFLMRICKDAGLTLKVTNKSIIILDEKSLESNQSVGTIKRTNIRLIDWSARTKLNGTFNSCLVRYTIPNSKKTIEYTFTPKKIPQNGRILFVNEEVKNTADAEKLAKNKLREANKDGTTMTIRFAGILPYYSGQTLMMKKFGQFNGKYIITNISINVGSGTETTIDLRKCLEGY